MCDRNVLTFMTFLSLNVWYIGVTVGNHSHIGTSSLKKIGGH